jgi:hypothetical protein
LSVTDAPREPKPGTEFRIVSPELSQEGALAKEALANGAASITTTAIRKSQVPDCKARPSRLPRGNTCEVKI